MSRKINTKKDVAKALLGALLVLIIIDLTPLSGNLPMYVKWVQCGNKPVHTREGAGMALAGVPNYVNPPNVAFLRGTMPYYCTPEDAENAGYSADPVSYSFPHLPADKFQEAISKSRRINSEQ